MKHLSKLKLHNATVLSDPQMKRVVGGYDGGGYSGGSCDKITCCNGKKEKDSCHFMCNGSEEYGRCLQS